MAQYYTDFSEYTAGAQPSDWTRRFVASYTWLVAADVSATGGKLLSCPVEAGSGRQALSWNLLDADADRADTEVFMRVRFPGSLTDAGVSHLSRASGVAGSETGLRYGLRVDTNDYWSAKYIAGTYSFRLATDAPPTIAGTFYNVLIQARGGTGHRVKYWPSADPEPVTWTHEFDNTDPEAAGWVGIFRGRAGAVEIDVYSVGTGTDSALRSAPAPATSVLTSPTASAFEPPNYAAAVTTDIGSGTLHHVVTQSATTPTSAQIKAGTNEVDALADASASQAVTTAGEQTIAGTGLTNGVSYYTYFVHTTAEGDSNIVSSGVFVAGAAPAVAVLTAPTAAYDGATGYTGSVSTDIGRGTLYHVVTDSATTPTTAEIKAGQNHLGAVAVVAASQAITAAGGQTIAGTGLSANVNYYIHYAQNSTEGDSLAVSSTGFSFAPAVPTPTTLPVTGITATSARLNWQAGV